MDQPASEPIAAPEAVSFQVEWTETSLVSFMRGYVLRQGRFVALGVLMLVLGIQLLGAAPWDQSVILNEVPWMRILLASFATFILSAVLCYGLGHMKGKRLWATTVAFRHPLGYTFTELEMRVTGEGVQMTTALATIHAARETSDSILLFPSNAVFYILPKHAIGDAATVERLRRLLRAGLPGTARVKLRSSPAQNA